MFWATLTAIWSDFNLQLTLPPCRVHSVSVSVPQLSSYGHIMNTDTHTLGTVSAHGTFESVSIFKVFWDKSSMLIFWLFELEWRFRSTIFQKVSRFCKTREFGKLLANWLFGGVWREQASHHLGGQDFPALAQSQHGFGLLLQHQQSLLQQPMQQPDAENAGHWPRTDHVRVALWPWPLNLLDVPQSVCQIQEHVGLGVSAVFKPASTLRYPQGRANFTKRW